MDNIKEIPSLVKQLYQITHRLEHLFAGRHFTPDGHLVGSLGEVLAAYLYGLELLPASTEGYDALSKEGKKVQIKATQVNGVALRSEPEHLIVLKIHKDGTAVEVFNGPGYIPWNAAGKMQNNGQRPISLMKLSILMKDIPPVNQLDKIVEKN
jgi:hypothetical protein